MPTIIELFKNKELTFSGTTADGLVDSKSQENRGGVGASISNYIEQETTGVRVKSLVDINNPLIYGNQAVRIAQRTTPDKDDMLANLGTPESSGGLNLNKAIGKARDAVNSFLGIPETLLPSRVTELDGKQKKAADGTEPIKMEDHKTNVPITKSGYGKNGSALGALLKASGGNPSTLATQAVGGALNAGKDALRGVIFGKPGKLPNALGKTPERREYYGTKKGETDGWYSTEVKEKEDSVKERMGIGQNAPVVPIKQSVTDNLALFNRAEDQADPTQVPFWIVGVEEDEEEDKIFFRTTVTGLSETSTPTWSGNKFVGNPYNYYTYDGVERAVTFNLNFYCMNQPDLILCWDRLTYLTNKTYPKIEDDIVNPPFIKFQLGDLYNGVYGFIESLTYTMPDMGGWEIDTKGIRLPKFVDASLTIKLLETPGDEERHYWYRGSVEALKPMKSRGITSPMAGFSSEPIASPIQLRRPGG